MGQDFLAVSHQSSPKPRNRVQLVQIRQAIIKDGKVDIEHVIGNVRNAQVEIAVKVYHGSNAMTLNRLPFIDRRRNKQLASLIERYEIHRRFSPTLRVNSNDLVRMFSGAF